MYQPQVFISYRRSDSEGVALVLRERLSGLIEPPEARSIAVFLDKLSIEPGHNFEFDIELAVSSCRVVVVLIGKKWFQVLQKRLASSEKDYVRFEIRIAGEKGKRVVPVLINGAKMPSESDLPSDIRYLALLNAITVPAKHLGMGLGGPTLDRDLADQIKDVLDKAPGGAPIQTKLPDDYLIQLIFAIDDLFIKAMSSTNDDFTRRKYLATALHRCCNFIDRRDLDEMQDVIHHYPPNQHGEIVSRFVVEPALFDELLRAVEKSLSPLGHAGVATAGQVRRMRTDLQQMLKRPIHIDEFKRSWQELRNCVCEAAAWFDHQPNPVHALETLTCCLASTVLMDETRRVAVADAVGHSGDAVIKPFGVAQIAAHVFMKSVANLRESMGSGDGWRASRSYWTDHDSKASLLSVLRNLSGSSAEACFARTLLAENFADWVVRRYLKDLVIKDRHRVVSFVANIVSRTSQGSAFRPAIFERFDEKGLMSRFSTLSRIKDADTVLRQLADLAVPPDALQDELE